jgi:hypothetical protein
MHQSCVFENKKQYIKSNQIMTEVIGEIFEKGVISQELKDAIESFQYKIALKEKYLANWLRKEIPNSYDAMTTSPVESLNCHIKHKTKANTLNNTSKSLLMITSGMSVDVLLLIRLYQLVYTNSYNLRSHPTGTDQRISDINKNAQRELQLTVISSKLSLERYSLENVYTCYTIYSMRGQNNTVYYWRIKHGLSGHLSMIHRNLMEINFNCLTYFQPLHPFIVFMLLNKDNRAL